ALSTTPSASALALSLPVTPCFNRCRKFAFSLSSSCSRERAFSYRERRVLCSIGLTAPGTVATVLEGGDAFSFEPLRNHIVAPRLTTAAAAVTTRLPLVMRSPPDTRPEEVRFEDAPDSTPMP